MSGAETNGRSPELWSAIDRLLGGATIPGILAHELGPLAAYRLRQLGDPVPLPLQLEERAASLSMLTAVPLLERIRASCEGPLMLLKGPEVATHYPGRARRFGDVDILSAQAEDIQRSLVGQGFLEVEEPEHEAIHDHHLQPLQWPAIPLKVELHVTPNWPVRAIPPPLEVLFEAAEPSSVGVAGVLAPSSLHHALIVSAHAWRHEPLQTLRDLFDVAVMSAGVDAAELERTARKWGIGRMWKTTRAAIDAVFYGGRLTAPLRSWARHLPRVRDRSVFERHLESLVHGYWELPPHLATVDLAQALRQSVTPAAGETWGDKLARARRALRNPRAPTDRTPRRIEGRVPPRD
jgi:hypothetical protein